MSTVIFYTIVSFQFIAAFAVIVTAGKLEHDNKLSKSHAILSLLAVFVLLTSALIEATIKI